MVDDIRVRGSGKSAIKSVYEPKMGQRQLKAVTVNQVASTAFVFNLIYSFILGTEMIF